jgi:glutaredoxin 3
MESSPNGKPKITVYTTDPCARCIRAKELLTRHELGFEEVNLAKDPVGRRELAAFTGRMTFPQIVVDGEPLGGFQELQEAADDGRLGRLAA